MTARLRSCLLAFLRTTCFALLLSLGLASAAAACESGACVSSGPRLASMNSSQATLYNGVLSQLTDTRVALTVADWNALAEGGTNLGGFLDALAAETGAAGRDDALAGQATPSQIVAAMASAARQQGRTQAAAALDALKVQVAGLSGTVSLADLIDSGSMAGAMDSVSLGTLDLITGLVQLYNTSGAAAAREPVTLSGESLGLAGVEAVRLSAQTTEPPVLRCGPAGTTFHSAAMRYKLDVDLAPSSPDLTALSAIPGFSNAQLTLSRLTLYGEVARGSGVIAAVDALARSVTVQATPGVSDLYLGQIPDEAFNDRSRRIDPATDLGFAPIGELQVSDAATGVTTTTAVEVRSHAQGQATGPSTLVYTGPYPQTQTARAGADVATQLSADLMNNMELRTNPSLGGADAQVQEALLPIVRDSLTPVVGTLVSEALSPALQMMGVGLGEMDVTVDSLYSLCSVSGTVFHDLDHDGRRAAGEGATGHAHYAKLLPAGQAGGPALQVVAVSSASGNYRFDAVPPGRYDVVINREPDPTSLAPVPPAGWVPTQPQTLARTGVAMSGADLTAQDFGLYLGSRLTGSVFRDSGAFPHDGRRGADEPGIANVAVRVADAGEASSATVYDRAVTDADGRWTLWVPATASATVRVIETQPADHLSTGADAGSTGGSYDHGSDAITFANEPGAVHTGLRFGDVPVGRFEPDGRQSALPGTVLFYAHRFFAGSRGTLTLVANGEATPAQPGWSSVLYRDVNCNGALDPEDAPLPPQTALAPDERLCVVAKVFVPAHAPFDAQHRLSLSASFRHDAASHPINFTLTREDLTFVGQPGDAALRLSKSADKSVARPGETLTYTIDYRNDGSVALTQLRIFDAPPPYTVFASAACGPLAAGATACRIAQQPAPGARGRIEWVIDGGVRAGASGSVNFSVRVD
jgi:uncharacterized repeat protein (TIGR01451 family)